MNINLPMMTQLNRADLRKISERDFQRAVREFAESQGWLVHTIAMSATRTQDGTGWRGMGPKGWPDLFMCRRERAVAIELKTEIGRVSAEQSVWLDALNDARILAFPARPRDALEIMELLRE